MGRAKRIETFLKRYDPKLFVECRDGKLCVFREGQRIESYEVEGKTIGFVRPAPYLIFALTKDWTLYTESVDWGIEPIMRKLKFGDLWNGRDVASEIIEQEEKRKESTNRTIDNHMEAYLKDIRREYARCTSDILTHNLKD